MKSSYSAIGDVAERFRLPTHVLRHWEDAGLLDPARDGAGRRRYVESDIVRVAVIVCTKSAGMSLDQIRVLLDEEAPERHEILQAHLRDLDERMIHLQKARELTAHAFECDEHDIATCPDFSATVAGLLGGGAWPEGAPRRDSHPRSSRGSGAVAPPRREDVAAR